MSLSPNLLTLVPLVFLLSQQAPAEPYPGQSDHREPPAGWFCSPVAKDKAHECHCKRMVNRWAPDPENDVKGDPPKEEDPLCEEAHVTEDKECKVWCHPQACLCPVKCDTESHAAQTRISPNLNTSAAQ